MTSIPNSNPVEQLLVAIQMQSKVKQIHSARGIARKRHELEEEEFEALLQEDNTAAEVIESKRAQLISTYEQYIDACLALRTYTVESEQKIQQMIKDLES